MLDVESTLICKDLRKNLHRKKMDFSPISDLAAGLTKFDVNSNNSANSPGHCSSQDGSFIQDDDMRLILEFGGFLVADKPAAFSASMTSSTSRRRRLTRFDADVIAQLDFDDFSASRDMAPLYDVNRRRAADDSVFGSDAGDFFGGSVLAADYGCPSPCHERSLSAVNLSIKNVRSFPVEAPPPAGAFISTDSLDSSNMSMTEENFLQNFCAPPNKRQYVLTFDKQPCESGLAVVSTILDSFSSFHGENLHFSGRNSKTGAENFSRAKCERSNLAEEQNFLDLGDELSNFSQWLADFPGRSTKNDGDISLDDPNCNKADPSKVSSVDGGFRVALQTLDENFNAPSFADKEPTSARLRNFSENQKRAATQNVDNHTEKFAYFSERNLKENNEDENNTVTWQRIKRSYDQTPSFPPTSKCISLPNLKPSPSLFSKFAIESVHENEAAELEDEGEGSDWNSAERGNCLLKVFQQQQCKQHPFLLCDRKFSANQCESGYQTGTGSSNTVTLPFNNQGNFDAHLNPFDAYTTADQCKLLTKINSSHNTEADPDHHFECAEYYVNGRCIDVNHNEAAFVPRSTSGWHGSRNLPDPGPLVSDGSDFIDADFDAHPAKPPPAKPPRTFRTVLTDQKNFDGSGRGSVGSSAKGEGFLLDRSTQTTDDFLGSVSVELPSNSATNQSPELDFLRLPFNIPPLNVSLTPFLRNFLGEADSASLTSLFSAKTSQLPPEKGSPLGGPPKLAIQATVDRPPFSNTRHTTTNQKGPGHVQDWDSLATLLPDNVVKCCKFFSQQNFGSNGSSSRSPSFFTNSPVRCANSPTQPASDSRIPTNSSSTLFRLNSPKKVANPPHTKNALRSPSCNGNAAVGSSRDPLTVVHSSQNVAAVNNCEAWRGETSQECATKRSRVFIAAPKSRIPLLSRATPKVGSKSRPPT